MINSNYNCKYIADKYNSNSSFLRISLNKDNHNIDKDNILDNYNKDSILDKGNNIDCDYNGNNKDIDVDIDNTLVYILGIFCNPYT